MKRNVPRMNAQARTAVSRTLLLVVMSLGAVWAAGQVTGGPPGSGAPEVRAPAAEPVSPTTKVEDLTQAEIDAELAEVEKALGGARAPNPGAQIAEKPLPADLAVALPSDI